MTPELLSTYTNMVNRLFTIPTETREMGDLLHATIGIAGESGELLDIVKKAWAYGQPFDTPHFQEELGDVFFYWIAAVKAAGLFPEEVIRSNMLKLHKRYPDGAFTAEHATIRLDKV
jgi:NTP pyrophosphatase (non-canonical NTP hydrolase)